MKIGIFGGCFNPPHRKHKEIAEELIEKGYVDKVIFVPTNNEYPKDELASLKNRYHMLQLMIGKNKNILISDYEKETPKKTYQVLDFFQRNYKEDEIYFLCGSDNLDEFTTWENYSYILENYHLLVIPREEKIDSSKFHLPYKEHIIFVDSTYDDISSTKIRNWIKEEKMELLDSYLDSSVLTYIKEKRLYQRKKEDEKMKEIVEKLEKGKRTIATMESCTGGGICNEITNIPGASSVLKFSAVTYCNEYKIKMGVPKETIEKYTVYSIETAIAMSHAISLFAESDIGVGVTGQLNIVDPNNEVGENNLVYINIYEKEKNKDYSKVLEVNEKRRIDNKKIIIKEVENMLQEII